jgi:hypothetical protein
MTQEERDYIDGLHKQLVKKIDELADNRAKMRELNKSALTDKSPLLSDMENELAETVAEMTAVYGTIQMEPGYEPQSESLWAYISEMNRYRRILAKENSVPAPLAGVVHAFTESIKGLCHTIQ